MRRTALLAPLAALGLATTAFAAPAAATGAGEVGAQGNYDGNCEISELCLYYNSNKGGAWADFANPVFDFAGARFIGKGAGRGEPVKNNAASACNSHKTYYAVVFFNSNHEGPSDTIPPGKCENLVNTYNENASFAWLRMG